MVQCLINDKTTNFAWLAILFFGLNSSHDLFDKLSKPKVEKTYLFSFFSFDQDTNDDFLFSIRLYSS